MSVAPGNVVPKPMPAPPAPPEAALSPGSDEEARSPDRLPRPQRPDLESATPIATVTTVTPPNPLPVLRPTAACRTSSPIGIRDRRPARRNRAMLTAGEHDDLLNPELYADYVGALPAASRCDAVPRVDTGRVLTVVAQDRSGPAGALRPGDADLRRRQQPRSRRSPTARVAFFPMLDRLGPSRHAVTAPGRAASPARLADRQLPGRAAADGHPRGARRPSPVRPSIVLDTTGSMGDEIEYLKSELHAILDELQPRPSGLDIRLAWSPIATRATFRHPDLPVHRRASTRCSPSCRPARRRRRRLSRGDGPGAWRGRWRTTGGPFGARCCWSPTRRRTTKMSPRPGRSSKRRARADPDHSGRRLGSRRPRRICHAGDGRRDPVALPLPHRRQRHRQSARPARGRLLSRHQARDLDPAGPRQPDFRPPGRARGDEIIRTVGHYETAAASSRPASRCRRLAGSRTSGRTPPGRHGRPGFARPIAQCDRGEMSLRPAGFRRARDMAERDLGEVERGAAGDGAEEEGFGLAGGRVARAIHRMSSAGRLSIRSRVDAPGRKPGQPCSILPR